VKGAANRALKRRADAADVRPMDANRDNSRARDVELPNPPEDEQSYLEGVETYDETACDPELCRCGSCGSLLVQPIDWSLIGRSHWRVVLRCPNCEWCGTGVFGQEAVDRFDRELDRGTRKLQATLTRVSRACMEAEIEAFADALETDLIVPFDFH
jgi:hypothetical protein